MKPKYFSGFVNRNRDRYDPTIPILPGCFKAEKRGELNAMASTMTPTELTKKAKELLKGCPLSPPVVLKMKLRHGDIMGMHGVDLQKYYEVSCPPIANQALENLLNTCLARDCSNSRGPPLRTYMPSYSTRYDPRGSTEQWRYRPR